MGYTVAELFTTLGVKIDDKDLQQLKQFDDLFKSAASSVRALRDELKALGAVKLPEMRAPGGGSSQPRAAGEPKAPSESAKLREERQILRQEERTWAEREKAEDKITRQEERAWAEREKADARAERAAKRAEAKEAAEWARIQAEAEKATSDEAEKAKAKEAFHGALSSRASSAEEKAWLEDQKALQRAEQEYAKANYQTGKIAVKDAAWSDATARRQREAQEKAERTAARQEAKALRERERAERKQDRGEQGFWGGLPDGRGSVASAVTKGLLGFATLAGALALGISAIKRMAQAGSEAADKTSQFTVTTGLTNKEMAKWQRFAAISGVPEGEMLQTLKTLQQARVKAKYGQGWGAWNYPTGGVSPDQEPGKVLQDLAAKTASMRPEDAQFWLNQVGVPEGVMYAMRKYGSELTSATQISEADAEAVRKMNSAFGELRFTLGQINTGALAELARSLLPLIQVLNKAARGAAVLSSEPGGSRALMGAATGNPFAFLPYLAQRAYRGITQHNAITVNGAKNPEETANVVDRYLRRHTDSAYRKAPDPSQNR